MCTFISRIYERVMLSILNVALYCTTFFKNKCFIAKQQKNVERHINNQWMGNLKKLHKTAAACTAPVQVLKAIISWLLNWQQHLADLVLLQSGAGELRKSTLFYRKGSNSDFHCYLQGSINQRNSTELEYPSLVNSTIICFMKVLMNQQINRWHSQH